MTVKQHTGGLGGGGARFWVLALAVVTHICPCEHMAGTATARTSHPSSFRACVLCGGARNCSRWVDGTCGASVMSLQLPVIL